MGKNDRRRRTRIPVSKVIKHSKYQVLGTPVFEENSAVDLSSGGISFQTAQEYKLGTLVLLEFEIGGEALKILVCVAWIKKSKEDLSKHIVGAELIAIDPEHKKAMQTHLAKLMKLNEDSKGNKPKKKNEKKRKTKAKKAKAKSKPKKK
ncbi:MAG: PilZ domain-containing protein [Bdellovibrionales bacterium]|nr:PilZ domain-containing protein [Bdellovibrionales bacterium]